MLEYLEVKKRLERLSAQNLLLNRDAHYRMAPYNRLTKSLAEITATNTRQSAVLVAVYPKANAQAHLVLIKRPPYNGAHGGQISFPGGKKELEDDSLMRTALRETYEEVGVLVDEQKVECELSQLYIPPSRFYVTPYLAFLDNEPEFAKDTREVEQIIQLPIEQLINENNVAVKSIRSSTTNIKFKAPYFNFFGFEVWGATAMILNELKEALLKSYEEELL